MLIEFFGLTGSGKTIIAKSLENNDSYLYIRLNSKGEYYFHLILFFIKRPLICILLLHKLFSHNTNSSLFKHKLLLFLETMAKYNKANSNNIDCHILDEGFYQMSLTIYETIVDSIKYTNFLKIIPKPDIIIIINSSKKTRRNRLIRRNFFPRQNFGMDYVNKWMPIMNNNFVTIEGILKKSKTNCIFISNNDDNNIDAIVKTINNKLSELR